MPGISSIEGLYSGLNTAEIVEAILAYERRSIDLLEDDRADKTNIISTLKALQAKFLALSTELAKLTRASTFDAGVATVSDDTFLSASANGRIGSGSYDIQVLSLARNHQIASQGFSDESLAAVGMGAIEIGVGTGSRHTILVTENNNSLTGIKQAINDAEIGVRASIIHDGSASNPYRLLLVADNGGAANKINITSQLIGGTNLDFHTATFDDPEVISMNSASTARVSLASTASYTGSMNKVYTFTVEGVGVQTVGAAPITVHWTDGVDSGSFEIIEADVEVELTGDGADGLKLSFSAGTLTTQDTFQVATFAPVLQEPSDARLAIGSAGGTGSPIIVTSDTNTFSDVIEGLSITAKKETGPGQSVTVSTDIDLTEIKNGISRFIDRFNDVNQFIDEQNTFREESEEVGVLFGDITVQMMQNSLRSVLASAAGGVGGRYTNLYAIGIRTSATGDLTIANSSRLEQALQNDLDDVIRLFASSGRSSSSYIEFVASTAETKPGQDYAVDVFTAATRGRFQGAGIADPILNPITLSGTNNRLRLVVDGLTSQDITLAERTYASAEELVTEIQSKIDGDPSIGDRGLTVEWVDSGSGTGYLNFVSSLYGSTSKVQIISATAGNAHTVLGLSNGTAYVGADVTGTINGEAAQGQGQLLCGKEDNATTAGLKLRVTLEPSQVVDGVDGSITISKGLAARLGELVDSFTRAGEGLFDRRVSSYQNQVDALQERIEDIYERLELRRESLLKEFYGMEEALAQLSAQGQFLTNQLAALNANWFFNRSTSL